MRVREHLLRFRAQKHCSDALTAMACHENDVTAVFFSLLNNRFCWREALHHHSLNFNTGSNCNLASSLKTLFSLSCDTFIVLFDRLWAVLGEVGIGIRLHDGHHDERGTERPGEAGGAFDGLDGTFRSVRRHENSLVHGLSS